MEPTKVLSYPVSGEQFQSNRKQRYHKTDSSQIGTNLLPEPLSSRENTNRGDDLKKIHAQSSTETSGLGDSLQRIHAFSSTETSGYGDGDQPAITPSPEYPIHRPIQNHQRREDRQKYGCGQTFTELAMRPQGERENIRHNSIEPRNHSYSKCYPELLPAGTDHLQSGQQSNTIYSHGVNAGVTAPSISNRLANRAHTQVDRGAQAYNSQNSSAPNKRHQTDAAKHRGRAMSIDVDIDERFEDARSRRDSVNSYGTPRYNPGSPTLQRRDRPLLRTGSGNFLGADMQSSTWLKWSQDRRASFKRRLDTLEKRQKEMEETRVSTPVMKARKESVMFVSPDFESTHLSQDEPDAELNPKLSRYVPNGLARKRSECLDKEESKLSLAQWNALVSFWEHGLFVKARYCGIVIAAISLILAIVSMTNQQWSIYEDHEYYGASYSGLWLICSSISTNCTALDSRGYSVGLWDNCLVNSTAQGTTVTCNQDKPNWQIAVIGLLVFAAAFGFLATMLAVCGICTTSLPRKVYYYHSSGEIYFVCALATTAGLLIYPVATERERMYAEHRYGYGYGLGWGCTFLYLASALCMCLDDIIRTLTRGCLCCRDDPSRRLI